MRLRAGDFGRLTRGARALVAALLALGVGCVASPAAAEDSAPVPGISVLPNGGAASPSIQLSRLFPGAEQRAVLLLDGGHPERVRRVEIGLTSLSDAENGCLHAEIGSGDTTCTDRAGQGELSRFLDVTVVAGREGRAEGRRTCQPVAAAIGTTALALVRSPVVVGLPAGGRLRLITTFAHRSAPGDNVTQTDAVSFDLRLRFDGLAVPTPTPTSSPSVSPSPSPSGSPSPTASAISGGSGPGSTSGGDGDDGTQVEGVKHERPVVVGRVERGRADLGTLPRTGASLVPQLALGATLLVVGTVTVGVVRNRRRRVERR